MAKQLWPQTDLFAASKPVAVMSEAERQKAITLLRTLLTEALKRPTSSQESGNE